MGSSESCEKGTESCAKGREIALMESAGAGRQALLRDLVKEGLGDAESQDFYAMFGLERYAEMDGEGLRRLRRAYRSLVLQCHPDKNTDPGSKEVCEVVTGKLNLGKKVLEDPDLKRRYDIELRRQLGEEGGWSTTSWWLRWGYAVVATASGAALVGVGAAGVVFTGGASLAASIGGSVLLISGLKAACRMYSDPDCSTQEFCMAAGVGALQGLACGGIGAGVAGAMAGLSVAAQIGIAGAGGAATAVTSHMISDAADLAVTEGALGQTMKENVSSAKGREEIFSAENAKSLAANAAIGAVAGVALQACTSTGETLIDDIAQGTVAAKDVARKAAGAIEDVGKRAINKSITAVANSSARAVVGFVAAGAATAIQNETCPLRERIRKLNPKVAHRLKDTAAGTDFMLSRTNLQKDFADRKVVSMLEAGFTLCADNSLQDGWGGRGWVAKYVKDAKATRFGILVLEGGPGFFESSPCCDELYAAREQGVNLTRLSGSSMSTGEYLWVEVTDELFEDAAAFEGAMRQKLAHRFTPVHYRATLGSYYDASLRGKQYTYYCVVPAGRNAALTGADQQRF